MIRTAEDVYYEIPGLPVAERAAALHPDAAQIARPAERPVDTTDTPRATAFVQVGEWVAFCATEGCWGCIVVSHADPRLYCPYCFNHDAGGQFVPVDFPADRERIEQLLSARPMENRFWFPHETVADLERENLEHGIEAA